ncbi:MAG: 50S ribosomal protein L22 [Chloroherpetonaceae bacterium]|jgi:large subunit ribosomal protein L22|nr:50S ribosomal protein L22 [bacterium]HAW08438.1 50S ribosomal protein L22 [Bacteroidota bacterium]
MEARCVKKYIRSSPVKMRLVIDQIRGKNANEAVGILHFQPKQAARVAEQTLRSAIANLNNKLQNAGETRNEDEYIVSQVFVNVGPTIKRIQAAPMGRAYRIKKRSNHLTIIVSNNKENKINDDVEVNNNKEE